MSNIKPSDHGIVVEHKESGVRYAVSDSNYSPDEHRKIRDLRAGETILGYTPKQGSAGSESDASEPLSDGPTESTTQ